MSHEMHHFAMGWWVLPLAYAVAVTGSYVGLACVRHALKFTSILTGALWLVMASVSIGGVGIWLMHFIGMVGFAVPGSLIRYDLALTTASVVLAVMATLFGLCSVVGIRLLSTRRLDHVASCAVGGLVMGLAVSLMHYSGMAAIRIQGTLDYDRKFVVASVIIAVAASTAALWVAGLTERISVRLTAALLMGSAVVAMHYTGMAGVHATVDPAVQAPSGMTVMALLFPAFVLGMIALAVPIVALLLVIDPADAHIEDSIARWTSPRDPEVVFAYDFSSAPTEVIPIPDEYRQADPRPGFHAGLPDTARGGSSAGTEVPQHTPVSVLRGPSRCSGLDPNVSESARTV
jgi:NO-binding membrane sensor protein with MHYT domain